MKKIYYFVAAMLLAGCAEESLLPAPGTTEGKKVQVEFAVPLPPETRGAMAFNPILDGPMYIAVFDKNQVLREFVPASYVGTVPNTNGTTGQFRADLSMANGWRSLHFIANCPVTAPAVEAGEAAVLNSIVTTGNQGAYWQRIVLENGINAYTYKGGILNVANFPWFNGDPSHFTYAPGNQSYSYTDGYGNTFTVSIGDYIQKNGTKVLTGEGFFASEELTNALSNIPLVRNFARVTVSAAAGSNFTPQRFALAYTPTAGYVAPNDNRKNTFADNWGFVSCYLPGALSSATTLPDFPTVLATGYIPYMPGNAEITKTLPTTFVEMTAADNAAYMYERPQNLMGQNPTCLIVGGTLSGVTGERWFKIQLADHNSAYFSIFRGVVYNIAIGTITGSQGYATPQEAFDHPALGDISGTPGLLKIPSISDNMGPDESTLTVNSTSFFNIGPNPVYRVLLYRLKHKGATPENQTPLVILTLKNFTSKPAILSTTPAKPVEDLSSLPAGVTMPVPPDANGGWYYSVVQLAPSEEGIVKMCEIAVKGPTKLNPQRYLERIVTFRTFPPLKALPQATSPITSAAGQEITLTLTLPKDLSLSMFPLRLKIESDQNNLNAATDATGAQLTPGLIAETGNSYFNPTKQSLYFAYTVDPDDYYDLNTQVYTNVKQLKFKTTKTSANPIRIAVTDKDNYFSTAAADAVVTVAVN